MHNFTGLPPVALKKSVTSDKRMSAEEKRMAKVLKPYEVQSTGLGLGLEVGARARAEY